MFYKVFFFGGHSSNAATAAFLTLVGITWHTFDITGMTNSDYHIFFFDQVFQFQFVFRAGNLASAYICMFFFNLQQFFFDDAHQFGFISQNCFEVRDFF